MRVYLVTYQDLDAFPVSIHATRGGAVLAIAKANLWAEIAQKTIQGGTITWGGVWDSDDFEWPVFCREKSWEIKECEVEP